MNKKMFTLLLGLAALACLPACGKKGKACCDEQEQTCKTRYSYDDCDACYQVDAETADIEDRCEKVRKI